MALAEIGARLRLQGADRFRRDTDRATDGVDRLGREADNARSSVGKMGRALGGIAKAGAIGGIGVAAVGLGVLSAGLLQGFKDAAALQTIMGKTNAVIASTKGVANVSAKSIVNLADELESLSGVDGDAIINAQNLLLTFTNVRNETGAMNHVFDQATKAAVDMAVALGQDPAAAAMQLGKALNDPIKGVSALGKAGVSFSDKQKKTIKTLVATNRVMDAQKIILGEMQVQFGGAAKAAGAGFEGSMARAKDAIGDLFRDVATPLLEPVTKQIERFSEHVNNVLAPALITFSEEFIAGVGAGGKFRDRMVEMAREARDFAEAAGKVLGKLTDLVGWMVDHEDAVKRFGLVLATVWTYGKAAAAVAWVTTALGIAGVGTSAGVAAGGIGAFVTALGPLFLAGGAVALSILALKELIDLIGKAERANEPNLRNGTRTVTTGPARRQPGSAEPYAVPGRSQFDTRPGSANGNFGNVPGVANPNVQAPASAGGTVTTNRLNAAPIIIENRIMLDGRETARSTKRVLQDEAARR